MQNCVNKIRQMYEGFCNSYAKKVSQDLKNLLKEEEFINKEPAKEQQDPSDEAVDV